MTLVSVAVSMLVLVGLAAVAVDGSNLYRERGDVQNAADLSAYAAAYDGCTGGSDPPAAGVAQAAANGFILEYDNGPGTLVFLTCSASSVDPSNISGGDRIITTVSVPFQTTSLEKAPLSERSPRRWRGLRKYSIGISRDTSPQVD